MVKIDIKKIIEGKMECRDISFEDAICEAAFQAIRVCNSEYQQAIQRIYHEFVELKRINKTDMNRVLQSFAKIELGEDINPHLENVEDNE